MKEENLEKIAEFHQSIAQQTVNMIFAEWDRIYLLGNVEKSREYPMHSAPNPILETSFYYVDATTKEIARGLDELDRHMPFKESKKVLGDLMDTVWALNKIFRAEAGGDWGKVWDAFTFTVEKGGKFNLDYHYDFGEYHLPIWEKYATLNPEVLWAYDTFGYKFAEGHPYRTALDKYLHDERN